MPPEHNQTREEFIKSLYLLDKPDNVFTGAPARKKIIKGIEKGMEAIALSYGSAGSNAIIEEDVNPFHRITNDGKTILQNIKLADPLENIGLNILKEVAEKQDREGGDGRKTCVLLTGAIVKEGIRFDEHPMALKKSLDECLPIILKEIDKQTKKITAKNVGKIAETASESESLGKLFQEIYEQIGSDGIVELDNSNISDTFYELIEGVRLLNCGFTYPYMANEDKGRKAVFKNPYILITKQKIQNITQLDHLLKDITRQGRSELVIFCDEIDLSVSQALAYLHLQGVQKDGGHLIFKTLVIKAPTLWKDWLFEDFAKITGAKIVDPAQGLALKNVQLTHLGICDKLITSKDETIVLGTKDISDHLKVLEDEGTDDSKIRIARLKTKTAILKLGANSESELSYLHGKALDGRNASYLALNGGVVPGAGLALLNSTDELPKTPGGEIIKKALHFPLNQILDNMGLKDSTDLEKISDPAIVVKKAITNAISVAGTILTSQVFVTKQK